MSIETDARQEAERIEQSNAIAHTVIEVAQNKTPREFVTLDFRYGIADALWDAGYRKVAQETQEPSDASPVAYALTHRETGNVWEVMPAYKGAGRTFNPETHDLVPLYAHPGTPEPSEWEYGTAIPEAIQEDAMLDMSRESAEKHVAGCSYGCVVVRRRVVPKRILGPWERVEGGEGDA